MHPVPPKAQDESALKRRWRAVIDSRTARTAVTYVAVGWALIEVAATVFGPMGWPAPLLRLLIVSVFLGFFIAVPVAWGFDARARKANPSSPDHEAVTGPVPNTTPVAATDPSVAVLAFADMSPARDQDYFCEGTAEEIINALNSVRGLRVASRSGSFQFKNRVVDGREIGRLLNVSAVLDGSVRKAGDRVRIAAQLVSAADGTNLWSETFDRKLEDIFAIQEEIARRTVQALRITLLGADDQRLQWRGTANLAAYDFYLRGRQLARKEKDAEQRSAAEMFRQAIRLDPEFAAAHAGLASVIAHLAFRHQDLIRTLGDEAQRAIDRALALAPDSAQTHVAVGQVHEMCKRPQEALRAFERAIELDARLFDAHYYFARFCAGRGDHSRAVEHYEKAFALQPDDFLAIVLALQEYQALNDREGEQSTLRRAWAAIERSLAIDPDNSVAYDHGAGVLLLLGRKDESRQFSERAIALRPDDPTTYYTAACCASYGQDYERALDLLARAVELGFRNAQWIMNDYDLAPLHDHPRFKEIMAGLGDDAPG
jgi:TolB-like protein/Tfp pilus assembly protein PilF